MGIKKGVIPQRDASAQKRKMRSITLHSAWLVAVSVVLVSMFVGCGGDDDDSPATPQAQVLFLHDLGQLGPVEVLTSGDPLIQLTPDGIITEPLSIDAKASRLSIRAVGATEPIHTEDFTFLPQAYLFVLTGEVGAIDLWRVDNEPPAVDSGALVEVANLFEGPQLDVYVGGALVAEASVRLQDPTFTEVSSGKANVLLFNTGDDPASAIPVLEQEIELGERSASMLIIRKSGNRPTVQVVSVR